MLKFKCLVLDHDDTAVMSTPTVNYQAFMKTLSVLRPGLELSLEQFMLWCFEPGFSRMCSDILGFSDEEMAFQIKNWESYVSEHIAPEWTGMSEIIKKHRAAGGLLCVCSHSVREMIIKSYSVNFGAEPDAIYGWETEESLRKPSPYPLLDIMERFSLLPHELIMIDDLKPGLTMARAAGAPFGWAGWSCCSPGIRSYMLENADYCFDTVRELDGFLFPRS